jgi:hypothetical protein
MKTPPCFFLLIWLAILPAAYSQPNGIVEGRLINRTDPTIIARGATVEVIELGGGMSIVKAATTDASAKFRIEGLPENQRLMIRVNYKEANYHGQLSFNSSGKAYVEIEVYEPTVSMKEIPVEGIQMAFQMVGNQLRSMETITFINKTRPPRTFTSPEGNFRISKPPGIVEPPQIRVTAPGSSMPLVQPALESADGKSYYSLYPLRPGVTTFEVQQILPYANRSYTYTRRFYQDAGPIDIGVIPQDLTLSGRGLSKIETNTQNNFAVYRSAPIKAGSEIVWTFSGGTPVSGPESSETAGSNSTVTAMPGSVGRNALIIGPLLLLGFILVLWYAFSRSQNGSREAGGTHIRQLKELSEQLINSVAELDHRYEVRSIGRQEFQEQREESKRRLRRISLLLKK